MKRAWNCWRRNESDQFCSVKLDHDANIHVSTGIKIVEFCLDLRKLEIDELGTNQ